ncbi:MAG TPA: NTF2-like N-terminal transpeptidase domain-containing protein, partial [Candidatus Sulfotelmatobacter sp.]|nr:NTF2-like N-terminal transpeptidase domain-containing protein [Candidatus Sulfotelmatobacter sp.]
MHPRRVIAAFFLALIFASCGFPFGQNSNGARQLVERFAGEWARLNADAYGDMYSMLTPQVKAANSKADFVQRYEAVTDRMALQRLSWRASEPTGAGDTVTVPLLVRYSTRFVGDFSRNVNVKVARQGNGWAIAWGPEVILPELARDGHLRESHQIPARGRILTRDGTLLAETDDHGLSVGVVTGHVTDETSMLQSLSKLLGMSA